MTVETTAARKQYTGNGVTAAFATTFKFAANADLVVTLTDTDTGAETAQTLDTDYTVSGAGAAAGGTVTFATPPASTDRVTIERQTTLTQELDYVENDPFPAESHEGGLDKLTMAVQEHRTTLARTLKLSSSDLPSTLNNLPQQSDRASRVMGFDASGQPAAGALIANIDAAIAAFLGGVSIGEISSVGDTATMELLTGMGDKQVIYVVGYYANSRVGGGYFQFVSGSAATVDDGLVLTAVGGRWFRILAPSAQLSPEMFGAPETGNDATDDLAALDACLAAAYAKKYDVRWLRHYYVSGPVQIPHNLAVLGVGAKMCGIYPLSTWAPGAVSYVVNVKQNPGDNTSDANFFCRWRDWGINALKVDNLGCLNYNAGGGSSLESMYISNGGANADQVLWNSYSSPGGGATVGQSWRNVWIGTGDGNPVCRNGVVFSGSGYSLHVDNSLFDYLSTGVSGTNGFAVKINGGGIVFVGVDMEGNPSPIYSNSSSVTFVGGYIRRKGVGSSPSTDADFAIEVASNENNMPNLIGTRIDQGYGTAGGSGGIAKVNGGAALTVALSSNNEFTYFNTREFTVQGGVRVGNTSRTDGSVLDWYKEDVWTPTIIGVTSAGEGTYDHQTGFYTRIGNRVFFNARVKWTAHTGTGAMRLGSLPYTPSSATRNDSICAVMADGITFSDQLVGYVQAGSTNIRFYQMATGAAIGSGTELPMDTAGEIYVSGQYMV